MGRGIRTSGGALGRCAIAAARRCAVVVVALPLAAGCATTVAGQAQPAPGAGPSSAPSTTAAAPAAPPPAAAVPGPPTHEPDVSQTPLAGVWNGTYRCTQGETALRLTVFDRGAGIQARFEFGPTPDNPGVPTGSFTMTGAFEGADLVLSPQAWINRPGNYLMIGLRAPGPIDPATRTLTGAVQYVGCSTFTVTR